MFDLLKACIVLRCCDESNEKWWKKPFAKKSKRNLEEEYREFESIFVDVVNKSVFVRIIKTFVKKWNIIYPRHKVKFNSEYSIYVVM